jgi:chromosome segregation ATPase
LKKSQHRADELEAKLEAAEKALEEARAKATTAEEKLAEEKSTMATREADIRLRLDTLNASFTSKNKYCLVAILSISPSYHPYVLLLIHVADKIGHSYEMP